MVTTLSTGQTKLVEDNHNMIYSFMRKYKLSEEEWYDVVAIGLVKAAISYIPNEFKFSTYAYKCMYNEMCQELIYQGRHWKDMLSIDFEYGKHKDDQYTIKDTFAVENEFEFDVINKTDELELIRFFDKSLSTDEEKNVFKLIIAGNNIYQISKELGISRWYVEKHISKIKTIYINMYLKSSNNSKIKSKKPIKFKKFKKITTTCNDAYIEKDINEYKYRTQYSVNVGDKIKVPGERTKYTVRARDDRYIICTRPYNDTVWYFIVDLKLGIRGEDNMIFCSGYVTDEECTKRLKELQNGEIQVSKRNSIKLDFKVA